MLINTVQIIFWICIFFLIYSYGLYPLLLLLIRPFGKKYTFIDSEYCPKVSIVIAAYNEEKVIERRIQNCLDLDYPEDCLEIIIASDGSDDKTAYITQNYSSQGVKLCNYHERRGKVNVLNETVVKAKNDIIVFSDANTLFKQDAIKKLVCHFQKPEVGCVCGLLQFLSVEGTNSGELEGIYWKYETFMKKIEGARGSLLGANGAIYAVRKELFFQCPEDTIIEDFVVPMKILQKGYKVVYEPQAIAIEDASKHIIQEKERRIRIGAGDFQALFRLLPMLNPLKGFSAFAFWSHKVLRWLAPFFLIFAFASNVLLLDNQYYLILFVIQCIFYCCAVVGQILSWSGIYAKFLNLCYYFVSMNFAILLGFFKFLTNRQSVRWERTERNE